MPSRLYSGLFQKELKLLVGHGAPGHTAQMEKWPWGALRERPVQCSVLSAQSQPQWTDGWQEPQVLEPEKPSVPSACTLCAQSLCSRE